MKPFFLSGANAKIKINNITLAYVTSLSYSVQVNHATPKVLGMYEASSIEPLSYSVSGSFSIIRYTADITTDVDRTNPHAVSNTGNGIGTWGESGFNISDGKADENLDPSKLGKAVSFDIEVYQKYNETNGIRSVSKIRNVRITKADFSLSAKSLANQTFNFSAIYVDEDSFLADMSGSGQQFT